MMRIVKCEYGAFMRIYFYYDGASPRDSFEREHENETQIFNVGLRGAGLLSLFVCLATLSDDSIKHYADSNIVTYISFHCDDVDVA